LLLLWKGERGECRIICVERCVCVLYVVGGRIG